MHMAYSKLSKSPTQYIYCKIRLVIKIDFLQDVNNPIQYTGEGKNACMHCKLGKEDHPCLHCKLGKKDNQCLHYKVWKNNHQCMHCKL